MSDPSGVVLEAVPQLSIRRRRVKFGVVVLAAIAMAGIAVFGLLQTGAFAVGEVRVEGNAQLPESEVRSLAAVEVGEPMISVDGGAVEGRLRSNPWVESAKVTQRWPDAIVVTVTERKAVAASQTSNGQWAQISNGGVVLAVSQNPVAGLPVLIGHKADPNPGTSLDAEAVDLVRLIEQLPDSLRPKVVQLQSNEDGEVRLGLSTGPIVELGRLNDVGDKLMAAAAVLGKTENADIKVLDVRSPRLPISTPHRVVASTLESSDELSPATSAPTGRTTTTLNR